MAPPTSALSGAPFADTQQAHPKPCSSGTEEMIRLFDPPYARASCQCNTYQGCDTDAAFDLGLNALKSPRLQETLHCLTYTDIPVSSSTASASVCASSFADCQAVSAYSCSWQATINVASGCLGSDSCLSQPMTGEGALLSTKEMGSTWWQDAASLLRKLQPLQLISKSCCSTISDATRSRPVAGIASAMCGKGGDQHNGNCLFRRAICCPWL